MRKRIAAGVCFGITGLGWYFTGYQYAIFSFLVGFAIYQMIMPFNPGPYPGHDHW